MRINQNKQQKSGELQILENNAAAASAGGWLGGERGRGGGRMSHPTSRDWGTLGEPPSTYHSFLVSIPIGVHVVGVTVLKSVERRGSAGHKLRHVAGT